MVTSKSLEVNGSWRKKSYPKLLLASRSVKRGTAFLFLKCDRSRGFNCKKLFKEDLGSHYSFNGQRRWSDWSRGQTPIAFCQAATWKNEL